MAQPLQPYNWGQVARAGQNAGINQIGRYVQLADGTLRFLQWGKRLYDEVLEPAVGDYVRKWYNATPGPTMSLTRQKWLGRKRPRPTAGPTVVPTTVVPVTRVPKQYRGYLRTGGFYRGCGPLLEHKFVDTGLANVPLVTNGSVLAPSIVTPIGS